MLRVSVGVVVLLVGVGLSPRSTAGDPDLKIGMLQGTFRDVQPAVVQALSRPFQSLFEKQVGLAGTVEIVPTATDLSNKLKDRKLDLGVFHGFEFAQQRTLHPDLAPICVTIPQGQFLEACVVVHKDSAAKELADLKGTEIVVPRGLKAHCFAYIEKARGTLPADCGKLALKPTQTTEEVLNALSVGEIGAALIDAAALSGFSGLQPGAAKQLRVLTRSEKFPPTVIVYRPGGAVGEAEVRRIRAGLLTANQTPHGRPLMMLWNMKGFAEVPADYDSQLSTILKSYPVVPAAK